MRQKFWSDYFDMDLLRLFPDLESRLGDIASTPIWTVGGTMHGRLNHPATWNDGFVPFWLSAPELFRDENGWFNIGGHVGHDPVVEATWLEVLRDAWPHQYPIRIFGSDVLLWNPSNRWPQFERIMWQIRGWGNGDTDITGDLDTVETDVAFASHLLKAFFMRPETPGAA